MARLQFNGPEKLRGLDIPMVKPGQIRVKDQIDLQRSTGMTMAQINTDATSIESFAYAVTVFASLRAAGIPAGWGEVLDLTDADVIFVREPGDDRSPDEGTEPDPTSAPTASAPDDVEGDESPRPRPARRKPTSPGSKTRSAGA